MTCKENGFVIVLVYACMMTPDTLLFQIGLELGLDEDYVCLMYDGLAHRDSSNLCLFSICLLHTEE